MNSGNIYRHDKCLDMDLFILNSSDDGSYEVMYLNRHSKMLILQTSEWVRVPLDEMTRWVSVSPGEYPKDLIDYLNKLRAVF